MNKLSRAQLDLVTQHIRQTKPHPALQDELVDHMAALIEQQVKQGQDFPAAFELLVQQTNPQVMNQLRQRYTQEFTGHHAANTLLCRRAKRRPATKPFHYIFLSNGLTLLILMGVFLVVIFRPLGLPIGVFHTTWAVGLAALGSVLIVRWWLKRRFSKPKPFANAMGSGS